MQKPQKRLKQPIPRFMLSKIRFMLMKKMIYFFISILNVVPTPTSLRFTKILPL